MKQFLWLFVLNDIAKITSRGFSATAELLTVLFSCSRRSSSYTELVSACTCSEVVYERVGLIIFTRDHRLVRLSDNPRSRRQFVDVTKMLRYCKSEIYV